MHKNSCTEEKIQTLKFRFIAESGWKAEEKKAKQNSHEIDGNAVECVDKLISFSQTLTILQAVDKHKNASNKLLHFCPRKLLEDFYRIIHSKAIMPLINFQFQYVYVLLFILSVILCFSCEMLFVLCWRSFKNECWQITDKLWRKKHWGEFFSK